MLRTLSSHSRRTSATCASEVAQYLRRRIRDDAREHFVAIYLDGRHRPIADSIVSIGTATASLVRSVHVQIRTQTESAVAAGSDRNQHAVMETRVRLRNL